ncbi:MAG: DUF1467 family protein [Sphingobacteriia bacterium]|nr:DUF1467 family protein [Sphingobacteriia bacterium]
MPIEVAEFITKIFNFISTYVMTWFLILFMVLPFGVKVKHSNDEHFAGSAPIDPQIKKKLIITSLITLPLALIIEYLVSYSNFNIKEFLLHFDI